MRLDRPYTSVLSQYARRVFIDLRWGLRGAPRPVQAGCSVCYTLFACDFSPDGSTIGESHCPGWDLLVQKLATSPSAPTVRLKPTWLCDQPRGDESRVSPTASRFLGLGIVPCEGQVRADRQYDDVLRQPSCERPTMCVSPRTPYHDDRCWPVQAAPRSWACQRMGP